MPTKNDKKAEEDFYLAMGLAALKQDPASLTAEKIAEVRDLAQKLAASGEKKGKR